MVSWRRLDIERDRPVGLAGRSTVPPRDEQRAAAGVPVPRHTTGSPPATASRAAMSSASAFTPPARQ